ncbi:scavenger receptor cysteine-rich type 1 protein M130-like [Sander vitreus]
MKTRTHARVQFENYTLSTAHGVNREMLHLDMYHLLVQLLLCSSGLQAEGEHTSRDSVRLVNGTSLCSGRLEVKTNQSIQRWSSVCEDDFDQQDAEVVCRELGCGPPSVLQGALYGEVEPPMRTKEFQCGGHESALLDCRSSGSDRNTCSPGKAVGLTCSEPVRMVRGASRCAGSLEVKHQGEWRPVSYITVDYYLDGSDWTLTTAAAACRELDCGSAVSVVKREWYRSVWMIRSDCVESGSALRECASSGSSSYILDLTCSDSVRLVDGTSLCSGRLEVKTNQSIQRWSSVCEDDFDQQDAEVVCRELGCGPPSVLQGALYGEVEPPKRTKEFQCGGHESALLDCRSSGSDRNTCSPGKAVGLTCSEPVRLVGGASRCAGTLEVKQGEWRPVRYHDSDWTLKTAAAACRELDCGSAVSVEEREESSGRSVWAIRLNCVQSGSALRDCAESQYSDYIQDLTCSDLLLQPNISVSSMDGVSEAQQQEFQVFRDSTFNISCSIQPQYPGGFFQLTFTSSNSAHNSTQPAVNHSAHFLFPAAEPAHQGTYSCVYRLYVFSHNFSSESRLLSLTVSEPVRLVGGDTRCAGTLELKHNREWRLVSYITVDYYNDWTMKKAAAACRDLDCGSAVSVEERKESSDRSVWRIRSECVESGSVLRECTASSSSSSILNLICSDSVRLVNGTSLCSGRLEVKTNQSIQRWSSVCEDDFDQQDAEVVCRELGCGPPSVLQGALYGEVEPPMRTKEFQCGGHESALLDCRSSGSDRNTCSPGKAVGLTCSEPVRLVGGNRRCAGTLEVKYQREWRPVDHYFWPRKEAAAACRELDCGSAVSVEEREESSDRSVWWIRSNCVQFGSALRECASSLTSSSILDLTCLDLLLQPNISVSSSMDGVSEAQQQGFQVFRDSTFTISCSIQPQYPGGFFQLTFTSSSSAHNSTQPAVNHSAHFLFPAAEPAHQGTYSCVYHLYVFSHNFSSESRLLSLTVSDPSSDPSSNPSDPPDPSSNPPGPSHPSSDSSLDPSDPPEPSSDPSSHPPDPSSAPSSDPSDPSSASIIRSIYQIHHHIHHQIHQIHHQLHHQIHQIHHQLHHQLHHQIHQLHHQIHQIHHHIHHQIHQIHHQIHHQIYPSSDPSDLSDPSLDPSSAPSSDLSDPSSAPSSDPSAPSSHPSPDPSDPSSELSDPSDPSSHPSPDLSDPSSAPSDLSAPSSDPSDLSDPSLDPSSAPSSDPSDLSDPSSDLSDPSSAPSDLSVPSSDPSDLLAHPSPDPSDPSSELSDPSDPSSHPSPDLSVPSSDPSDLLDPSSDLSVPSSDPSDLSVPSSDPSDLSVPSSDPSDLSVPSSGPSTHRPFIIGVVVFSLTLLLVITALSFYCKASRGQKPDRQKNIELYENNLGVPESEGELTDEDGAQGAE